MLRLTSNIKIGPYTFKGVHNVEVDSSWDNLTDTCVIQFPREVSWQGRSLVGGNNPLLKRGMAVQVKLGYDDKNTEVFRGYVRHIGAEIPVRIECEDEMFNLKKGAFNGSYRTAKSSQVISDVLKSQGLKTPLKVTADVALGQFRISKATPAKVFEYLREHYFVRAFFREGTLYAGLPYVAALQRQRTIRFDRNVISHNLAFRQKDDVTLHLKGIIVMPDNSRKEVFAGEKEGEQRTFHYYNISKSEAKKMLAAEMERLKYTGYRGSFTTFGVPDIRHGDVIKLADPLYPERDGKYLVKRIKINFGTNGYRQEVELEAKA